VLLVNPREKLNTKWDYQLLVCQPIRSKAATLDCDLLKY